MKGALLLLLHRPGRAFDFHDATCLVLLQVIQSVMLGNSPISTWFATRFARVGRIRYWSFSEDGLRSSEVFGAVRRGMGNSYKQITRYWSELTSIEEITEGLVLRFDDSTEAALIPKNSIPLKQWDSVLSHLRGLRLEIAN